MMFGLSPIALRIIIIAAVVAASVGIYAHWQHVTEQRGADRATAIYERQLAALAKQAATQATEHRAQMRSAEQTAIETIATNQANIRSRQNELRKVTANLAACSLGLDAVRVLNAAARGEPSPAPN